MKARCIHCKWHWGVSVRQEIPRTGYECPICAGKRKRAQQECQFLPSPRKNYLKCIIAQNKEVSQI